MTNQDAAPIVHLVQNDTGREIECNILDFDIPAGATSKLWLIKPSGEVASCNGTISGNAVTVALTDQVVAEKGMCVAQLKITKDGKTLSSFTMHFNFEEDASTNGIISQEEIKLVETFIAEQKKKLDAYIAEKTKDIEKLKTDVGTLSDDLTTLRNDHNTDIESLQQNSAPPIILTATGESIALEDSAERRVQGLRIFGKTTQVQTNGYQLFDASKLPSKTAGGATVTNNGDGSFTVSGSGNLTNDFNIQYEVDRSLVKIGKMTLKGSKTYPYLRVKFIGETGEIIRLSNEINTVPSIELTKEILDKITRVEISFWGNRNTAILGGTIKAMLYQDGDGTWEPYTGDKPSPSPDYPQEMVSVGMNGEIKTFVHSTQLFDASKLPSKTAGGATVTNNENGSFTISGSGNLTNEYRTEVHMSNINPNDYFKTGNITFEADSIVYPRVFFKILGDEGSKTTLLNLDLLNKTSVSAEITKDILARGNKIVIGFSGANGTEIKPATIKPMLYQDGDGTWEPYKPLQSLSLQTPNGLPGIPISSGGNYTDENGQQWICDEIDLKRGVYVQRVKRFTLNGTEDWKKGSADESNGDYVKNVCKIPGLKLIGRELQGTYIGIMTSHFKGREWTCTNHNRHETGISLNILYISIGNRSRNIFSCFPDSKEFKRISC